MSALVGGWLFRESLTNLSGGKSETVNFSTLGMSGGTEINIYFIAGIMRIEYINPNNFVDVYQSGTGWVKPSYRFIDFGIEPQEVSDEFYNWFIANAIEQDVKCDIFKALETTTKAIKNYSDNKDGKLKQEIETKINDSLSDKIVLGNKLIDTSIAHVKDVPSDTAKYAGINKIGGMTRKCTNLFHYPYLETTKTADGITFTDNGNGSVSANGTASGSGASFGIGAITLNHRSDYTLSIAGSTSNLHYQIRFYDTNNSVLSAETIETGVVNYVLKADAIPANAITMHIYIKRLFDGAVSGTFSPMLNEGSTALPYEPYFEGLRDAKTTEMKSAGVDGETVLSTLPIPEAVQAIDGYGWGINANCYNYVDCEKKQFVKRVEKLTITTVQDNAGTAYDNVKYYCMPKPKNSIDYNQYTTNILIANYRTVSGNWGSVTHIGKVSGHPNREFYWFGFPVGTTIDEAKAVLLGREYYYELAEPIITDISDLLPEDNFIEVEGNGSITAVNEYGYDVPSEIVFNIKNNEQVNANTFVGDLIGRVHKVREIYKGEVTDINRFYRGEVEDI